jgi:hypothetical protein
MDLVQFAKTYINPESTSTNPAHKRWLGYCLLDEVSDQIDENQWQKLHDFIDADFDFSILETK